MKLSVSLTLFAAVSGILLADYLMVSNIENEIKATCQTRVAYDRSGDMVCLDIPGEKTRLVSK